MRVVLIAAILALVGPSLERGRSRQDTMPKQFTLNSHSFSDGENIPKKYTCDAENVSPELHWSDPPAAKAFALIVDDPDAPSGTWVHWVLVDLPAAARDLPEAAGKAAPLPSGAQQGKNDFGKSAYGGPCPPPGKPHRYFFKLYALDAKLSLKEGVSKAEVEKAIEGHILGQAQLIGRYGR
jgi:Raf kinase inhibitor-like YbhB/YbcL family protein